MTNSYCGPLFFLCRASRTTDRRATPDQRVQSRSGPRSARIPPSLSLSLSPIFFSFLFSIFHFLFLFFLLLPSLSLLSPCSLPRTPPRRLPAQRAAPLSSPRALLGGSPPRTPAMLPASPCSARPLAARSTAPGTPRPPLFTPVPRHARAPAPARTHARAHRAATPAARPRARARRQRRASPLVPGTAT